MLDKSKYPATRTINGITFTSNGDGTITVNGTATARAALTFTSFIKPFLSGKFLLIGCPNGGNVSKYFNYVFIRTQDGNFINGVEDVGNGGILNYGITTRAVLCQIIVMKDTVCDNIVFKPQLFDLTEMYGAGNEPTTVEEFRQDFPDEMYDYSPRCFITSYKNCLKVSDYCQLLDKSKYPATTTKAGVTFANNGDGSIVVNGTCTADTSFYVGRNVVLKNGHQYLLFGAPIRGTWTTIIWTVDKLGSNDNLTGNRYTHKGDNTTSNCYIFVAKDFVADNLVFKPQLFDLTEIYGAGNEPTTVDQFRADFPDELYDYKPYSIVPSYKKSLACKTKNLFDISKLQAYTPETLPQGTAGVYNGNIIARARINSSVCESGKTLKELCPDLVAGERYTLSFETSARSYVIYLRGANEYWYKNNSSVVTEAMLNSLVGFYANYPELTVATISNFQIEFGNTATDYVPYGHL